MSQWEAWIVTALGMSVVFIGLVACIGFIRLIGRLAPHVRPAGRHAGHAEGPAPDAAASAATHVSTPGEPVPADVLAVISVVLELERKLYMNRPGARVTIRRHAQAP